MTNPALGKPTGHLPSDEELRVSAAACLERVRADRPAVHCITNTVAANTVANALLALGAEPSMTSSVDEVADFVSSAQALSVNLGTLNQDLTTAIEIAVATANKHAIPWQLDPVFVQRSPTRLAFAERLIELKPAVVRANNEEMRCFTTDYSEFSQTTGITIAITAAQDRVIKDDRQISIHNGHPLMSRVTATGCAASALVAAFLVVERDPWIATASALCVLGIAGELAAKAADKPGLFHTAMIDALFYVSRGDIYALAKTKRHV